MSIIFLKSQGFVGLRVRRNINGVPHERRYSFQASMDRGRVLLPRGTRDKLTLQAKVYDRKLEKLQLDALKRRREVATPLARSSTAISGISLSYVLDRRADHLVKKPAFVVACRDKHSRPVKTAFRIGVHGYDEAWRKAVKCFIRVKGISRQAATKLMQRTPKMPKSKR